MNAYDKAFADAVKESPSVEPVAVQDYPCRFARRVLSVAAVEKIAESMRSVGQQCPIILRVVWDEDGVGNELHLIAGAHRLAAAKMLGWSHIQAIILDDVDDLTAEQIEIAENLHRAELTALERDEQIARWMELEEQKQKPAPVGQVSGGRGNTGGEAAASRELGIARTTAQKAKQAASLSEEAKETARAVGLDDNQSALLEAAKKPKEEQAAYLRQRKENEEAAKLNRERNKAIALGTADDFAEWLYRHAGSKELLTVISWLEDAKPKQVIQALRRRAA